jgi:hypothetical protein
MPGRVGLYRCHIVAMWGACWAILERYKHEVGYIPHGLEVEGHQVWVLPYGLEVEGQKMCVFYYTDWGVLRTRKVRSYGCREHLARLFGLWGVGG